MSSRKGSSKFELDSDEYDEFDDDNEEEFVSKLPVKTSTVKKQPILKKEPFHQKMQNLSISTSKGMFSSDLLLTGGAGIRIFCFRNGKK